MNYNYSIICEDITQFTFIKKFLEKYSDSDNFILNEKCYHLYKCKNSREVLNSYFISSNLAFSNYSLDLLFVGVDYDDRNKSKFKEELDKLYNKLSEKTRNKTIILFPVQAIEHWLLYIKHHKDNPKSTKNITFEKIKRIQAKIDVYGRKKPNKKLSIQKTEEILQNLNIKWLVSKSESFKYFYNNFNNKKWQT